MGFGTQNEAGEGFLRGGTWGSPHRGPPGGIDVWGTGTIVTVSSATPRPPSLFPLVPCGPPASEPPLRYAIGCVALGFLPDDLAFSWSDAANRSAEGAVLFPSVPAPAGLYAAASRLGLPWLDGKSRQPFRCRARHPRGTRDAEVANPGTSPAPLAPPTLELRPPSREDFEGPFRNSTVLCRLRHARRPAPALDWLKNGAPLGEGVATETAADGAGGYVTRSRAGVTEAEWDAGAVFTCRAGDQLRNTSKALECGYDNGGGEEEIAVEGVAPAFAEIFREKTAILRCRVSNLPGVEGLAVSWRKETGEELETEASPRVLQPNGLFRVEGVAKVCADEWEKGGGYACRVSHPELLFPKEVTLRRTPARDAKAPSIYVFPPPVEQLAARETATVTCLVKGFNPPDLFVRWLRNGEPLPDADYVTAPPLPEARAPASYFTHSALTVAGEDWAAGNVFTCLVGHEQLPLQVAQKSVDRASGKPTAVNVSLVLADAANACY